MKDSLLYKSLFALCEIVIDSAKAYKEKYGLEIIRCQHIPVLSIDYKLDTFQYDWKNIQHVDYFEWKTGKLLAFIDDLQKLPEYENSVKRIASEFGIEERFIRQSSLFKLIQHVAVEAPNGRIDHQNVSKWVDLFLDDFVRHRENRLTWWNIDLWLENIYIESELIEIADGISLRRISKTDLADTKERDAYVSEFDRMTGRKLPASVVFSFGVLADKKTNNGMYPTEVTKVINNWLSVFWLFKPNNIAIVHQKIHPVSFYEYGSTENKDASSDNTWRGKVNFEDTSSYKLHIATRDEALLIQFVNRIQPILYSISQTNYLTGSPYDLAFHRYNDALIKSEVNAYRILSSISSFEAILSDGNTEITFKMRLRISKLLFNFGYNPIEVSKKIRDAYELRSRFVHGAKVNEKKDLLKFARENTHEILNYNRICLLVLIQVQEDYDKANFINLIDSSFIDPESDKRLSEIIRTKVVISIVNPFNSNIQ